MSVRPENKFSDYILILPEERAIISFTSMQDENDRRMVWGCRIREEENQIVHTALIKAKAWRRESYELIGDQLIWTNKNGSGTGVSIWAKIREEDIPDSLRARGIAFLERLESHPPPVIIEAEQDVPPNA
jgi:hypothetical protein